MVEAADPDGLAAFGFDRDAEPWLHDLADALLPAEVGPIGPYEIEREVARGGQGVVYRARHAGTRRVIALKRLVEGRHASAGAQRRFEREVETAARLRHPGIVTVLGYEVVEDVPTLAMQWIDGRPIDAWARAATGPGRERRVLACFLQVCEAVEHAHRHGILHLDLKPSNVLVGEDDRPVVLDFGLARFEQEDAGATRSGTFLGTLAYASPEQMRGARGSLDVRSDVYALGVMLYELCTGTHPFPFEGGIARALERQESGRFPRVRERIPGMPRLLARELDAIAARALAAQRAERYPTVSALAEDVRRVLDGRRVLAHPPSFLYDVRKLARRHRAIVALGIALLLSSTVFALYASSQARALARESRKQEEAHQAAERAQAQALEEAEARAGILTFLLDDLFDAASPKLLGPDMRVAALLQVASERASERFARQPAVELELRETLGLAYQRIGRFSESERELRRALELADGDRAAQTRLKVTLAGTLNALVRFDEAAALFDEALADQHLLDLGDRFTLHNQRGMMLSSTRRSVEAEDAYDEALEVAYAREDPSLVAIALKGLGLARAQQDDLDAARAAYGEALDLMRAARGPRDTHVAQVLSMLSDVDQVLGFLVDAIASSRESAEIFLEVYGEDHPSTVAALGDLGEVLSDAGRLEEADGELARAVRLSEQVRGADSIITAIHRLRYARNRLRMGQLGDNARALEELRARIDRDLGVNTSWGYKALDAVMAARSAADDQAGVQACLIELIQRADGMDPPFKSARAFALTAETFHGLGRRDDAEYLARFALADAGTSTVAPPYFVDGLRRRAEAYYAARGDPELVAALAVPIEGFHSGWGAAKPGSSAPEASATDAAPAAPEPTGEPAVALPDEPAAEPAAGGDGVK